MSSGKRYTEEFKTEAVKQVTEQGCGWGGAKDAGELSCVGHVRLMLRHYHMSLYYMSLSKTST